MNRDSPGSSAGDTQRQPLSGRVGTQVARDSTQVYAGRRDRCAPVGEACSVTVDDEPLDCRYDLLSASPSGFEWGYGGSGPAQLAMAILAHAYDDEFARENYQQFKGEIIATLPEEGWTLTTRDLDEWQEVNIE